MWIIARKMIHIKCQALFSLKKKKYKKEKDEMSAAVVMSALMVDNIFECCEEDNLQHAFTSK